MKKYISTILFAILVFSLHSGAQSIVSTVHNLSVSGPGSVKATSESEICIFCHTPHNGRPDHPLWNRNDPGLTYTLYNSSTTQALPGQPDGSSILCLSCHDGTIALGNVISRTTPIQMAGGITTMPAGLSNLTQDLSNDHPISFVYDAALAQGDGQLKDPATLVGNVKLENNKLQCTSCHDAHKNVNGDFLVATTQSSDLCLYCHQPTNWTAGSHRTSTKTWNGSAPDPWFHTPYTTVAQNGCENCHNPHTAEGKLRLLDFLPEENNCLDCHNGNVASKNILTQMNKSSRHNVFGYLGLHDPVEGALVTTKHVECVDCHNSHSTNNTTASAPNVNGFNIGVKGINQSGNPVSPAQYQYEICYRCHTATPGMPPSPTNRQIVQNNVRLEFATSNPSYHAVVGQGVNPNVPSLIAPNTTATIMYCTACHASDGTGAPAGPHGSIYPHILKLQYLTADNTTESAAAYALCYSCHSRTSILGDISFGDHDKHIRDERTPCNVCHDPHGISSTQGNSINNSNLINFNTSVVTPSSSGILRFEDRGLYHGRCYLRCHGEDHNPLSY
ncbi:MAG: cytochrome c3 family protein [bacterium]